MKNILILTDFSKNANNAIDYALHFFSGETIKFYVLNVQKVSRYITSDLIASPKKSIYESVIKNPKKSLGLLIDGLKEKYKNEDYYFEGICDYDSFLSAVKQVVEIKNIDLIVMGTNGASGIKETVFGSNTVQIVKAIDLPILVVPEGFSYHMPDKILFVNEIDIKIDEHYLNILANITSKYNAQLDVLVSDNQREPLETYLNLKHIEFGFLDYGNKNQEDAIIHFTSKREYRLVVKTINVKSFFKRIFSTDIDTNIAYMSKVPLLFL